MQGKQYKHYVLVTAGNSVQEMFLFVGTISNSQMTLIPFSGNKYTLQ